MLFKRTQKEGQKADHLQKQFLRNSLEFRLNMQIILMHLFYFIPLPLKSNENYRTSKDLKRALFTIPQTKKVASLSLFVPPESIPGRVTMAMTTLLTLAAMFGAVR